LVSPSASKEVGAVGALLSNVHSARISTLLLTPLQSPVELLKEVLQVPLTSVYPVKL
jgi:hypothetical protein